MGKIKNWKNLDWKTANNSSKLWVNRHPTATSKFGKPMNRGKLKIQKNNKDGKWYLMISRSVYEGGDFQKQKNLSPRKFDTKEEARKEAVKWMRNHPAG